MTAALPPLDEALLHRRLLAEGGGAYARIVRVESVDSTNQQLIEALGAEARSAAAPEAAIEGSARPPVRARTQWPHLSVLTAEEQTGGRGRLGRVWSSPRGASLSTSLVLRPRLDPAHLGWLSMLAGRALVDTLRQDFGLDAEHRRSVLKWPNDVQITQAVGPAKKISGILAAAFSQGRDGPSGVVLGVGINVLLTAEQLPVEGSTSVLLELDRRGSGQQVLADAEAAARLRTELLCRFLERFAELLGTVEAAAEQSAEQAAQVLVALVGEVLGTLGQQVRVELPDGSAERGRARGLAPSGALEVEVTARRDAPEQDWMPCEPVLKPFSAGDVTHLRPTP